MWLFCTRRPNPPGSSFERSDGGDGYETLGHRRRGGLCVDGGGLLSGSRRHSCPGDESTNCSSGDAKLVRLLHRRQRRLCVGQQLGRVRPDAFYGPLLLGAGIPGTLAGQPKGFVGGITYGSNYQFNRLVIGITPTSTSPTSRRRRPLPGRLLPFVHRGRQSRDQVVLDDARARRLPADGQLAALRDRAVSQRPGSTHRPTTP